jgi:hypothetical protein
MSPRRFMVSTAMNEQIEVQLPRHASLPVAPSWSDAY